ncbi:MAG: glycosyltransferase family 39 protein [Thermoguttaceae bacterium]
MSQSTWRPLVLLLLAALVLRLAAGWAWQSQLGDQRFGMGDSESYWHLAQTIAQGEPYCFGVHHARAFRTPGYPVLLAPIVHWAGDTPTAILLARAEAALLGTLAVGLVWWLARLLFDARVALLAAALATFYPGAILLSALILSEAPFCPLMLLQLALWTLAWQSPTARRQGYWAFCGGLVAGIATLMRPSWLLFTPLAALGALAFCRGAWRRHGRIAGWMCLGLALAMTPWWIRNAMVFGRFVPTTLQVGASLYDGLNPQATGASNMDFVARFESEQPKSPDFEWRLDRRLRDESLQWTRSHEGQAMRLVAEKFIRMWNVWPNEPRFSSWPVRGVVFFTYTPLLFFAIIGACKTFGRGWPYPIGWFPAAYLTLLHVVFVSSLRYREPAMLAMLALAAAAMFDGKSIVSRWSKNRVRSQSDSLTRGS